MEKKEEKQPIETMLDQIQKCTDLIKATVKYSASLKDMKKAYEAIIPEKESKCDGVIPKPIKMNVGNYSEAIKDKESQYKKSEWVWRYLHKNKSLELVRIYETNGVTYMCNGVDGKFSGAIGIANISHKATTEEVEKALIEYAEGIYKKNHHVKSLNNKHVFIVNNFEKHFDVYDAITRLELNHIEIWTSLKGWAEIIKPDYENSLKEVFYYGDTVYWVNKKLLAIHSRELDEIPLIIEDYTEYTTKESAEKWIEKNKPKDSNLNFDIEELKHLHYFCYKTMQCSSIESGNFRIAKNLKEKIDIEIKKIKAK